MQKAWKGLTLLAVIAAIVLVAATHRTSAAVPAVRQSGQSDQSGPARFTANAISLNGVRASASQVEIDIKRWSTDGQREQLLTVLKTKGEQALLDTLQKQPVVGTIRTPDSLAYDLHYARKQPWDDGGEQVMIATDRPISFWETRNDTRSLNYPFTVIELRVKGNGTGEGKMSVATKVIAAGNQIILENYETQPVLLTDVRKEQK